MQTIFKTPNNTNNVLVKDLPVGAVFVLVGALEDRRSSEVLVKHYPFKIKVSNKVVGRPEDVLCIWMNRSTCDAGYVCGDEPCRPLAIDTIIVKDLVEDDDEG